MPLLLLLLILFCRDADASSSDQQSSRSAVNPNAMWIAAVAGGMGMLVIVIAIFLISTFFLRLHERKCAKMLAPMLARMEPPTVGVNDDPRQLTSAARPGAASSLKGKVQTAGADEQLGKGHVYYNRGLDVGEAEPGLTMCLDPRPIKTVTTRRPSGHDVSVI